MLNESSQSGLAKSWRLGQQTRWLWCAGLFCIMLSMAVIPLDSGWSSDVRGWKMPGDIRKLVNLSEVFAHGFGAAAILGTLLWISRERRRLWVAALITAACGVTGNVLKSTVVRVRPYAVGSIEVEGSSAVSQPSIASGRESEATASEAEAEAGQPTEVPQSFWDARQRSFPSGHAATAWGLAIGLSVVYPRGIAIFCLFATLACWQRVASGAHFPSDVLAGAAVAFACSACLLSVPGLRQQLGMAVKREK